MADELKGEAKTGIQTAIAGLHDAAALPPGCEPAEQLSMLPLSQVNNPKNAPSSVPQQGVGGGRPPGSRNKATEAWREYLLSRFESPLEGLAKTATATLAQLRDELQDVCGFGPHQRLTLEQAAMLMKVRQDAQSSLAPYLHGKMPLEINANGGGFINLTFQQPGANAPADHNQNGAITIASLGIGGSEQNQGFIDADFEKSNGDKSNGSPKGEPDQRDNT